MVCDFRTGLCTVLLGIAGANQAGVNGPFMLGSEESDGRRFKIPCSSQYSESGAKKVGCTPLSGGNCDRVVEDAFLNNDEVEVLKGIAEKGMRMGHLDPSKGGSVLGPTIMDVNSGWVLPAGSHEPLAIYRGGPLFSAEEYDVYRRVTARLKKHVEASFGLSELYFTAPTFITREAADIDGTWAPATMHDEYWHPHVDKNNTDHYDYSGLVYLSTAGEDFEGGNLEFYKGGGLDCRAFEAMTGPCAIAPESRPTLVVSPRRGRAIVFGSGRENPHRVARVTGGTRFVLSFWFTCDSRREMKSFLDGKMHIRFGETGAGPKNPPSKTRATRNEL